MVATPSLTHADTVTSHSARNAGDVDTDIYTIACVGEDANILWNRQTSAQRVVIFVAPSRRASQIKRMKVDTKLGIQKRGEQVRGDNKRGII